MIKETLNYLFEEKKQDDGNIGVIHVYRKNDNAWVGFIRYAKKGIEGKPFVKFHASDLGIQLDDDFKKELNEVSKSLSKEWTKNGGTGFKVNSNFDFKLKMIIDKGDGKPPKHLTI